MLLNGDTNATKILTLITQTFMAKNLPRNALWDELNSIWQLIVMCPLKNVQSRTVLYSKTIQNFVNNENMPRNEANEPLLQNCLNLIKTDYETYKSTDVNLNILKILSLNAHGNVSNAVKLCKNLLKTLKNGKSFQIDYNQGMSLYNILYQNDLKRESLQFATLILIQPKTQNTQYQLEKWLKSEETFIANLKITECQILESFLKELNVLERSYNSSLPLYNVAKYFYNLNPSNFIFKIALKYLSKPPGNVLKEILEQNQVTLALILIKGVRSSTQKLNQILKQLNCIKSASNLFKIAQESLKIEENLHLTTFSFQIGLQVLKQTLKTNHRKRWDILRWVLNSSLNCGYYSVLNLLDNWPEYFSPNEVVGSVVSQFLSRGTGLRLGLSFVELKELGDRGRAVAVEALKRVNIERFKRFSNKYS
jgi:hypothetical protein